MIRIFFVIWPIFVLSVIHLHRLMFLINVNSSNVLNVCYSILFKLFCVISQLKIIYLCPILPIEDIFICITINLLLCGYSAEQCRLVLIDCFVWFKMAKIHWYVKQLHNKSVKFVKWIHPNLIFFWTEFSILFIGVCDWKFPNLLSMIFM